jgi:predicted nucleic acid-binding protein
VKVFLDTSVLLSASGSGKGASRYIVENAQAEKWELVSSHYCREETARNLNKLGADAEHYFAEALDGMLLGRRIPFPATKL